MTLASRSRAGVRAGAAVRMDSSIAAAWGSVGWAWAGVSAGCRKFNEKIVKGVSRGSTEPLWEHILRGTGKSTAETVGCRVQSIDS